MEHRYSNRVGTDINVLIYKAGIPVAYGRAVNGCKLGFFIETEFSDVNIEQALDIEFLPSSCEEVLYKYTSNVRVIRKTDLGLGVEIEFTKAESLSTFKSSIDQLNVVEKITFTNDSAVAG
jgi:hypothetical protein